MSFDESLIFPIDQPLSYRWSGRFIGAENSWKHMERQLVDYELMVIEKGVLYIEDEWERYEVHEGEYLLMSPTKLQRGYRASKCRFYWMHFLIPAKADGECQKQIQVRKHGGLKDLARLLVLMKQLQDSDLRYMDTAYNDYLTTSILLEIANQQVEDSGDLFMVKLGDYLIRHMSAPISVPELAREFGYHEKYFSMLFKKKTGKSVKKYVDDIKMERARYLLLNTDAYVTEIAEQLGYEDVQNFYHVFKKAANCTPSEFRRIYDTKKMEKITTE